MKVPGPQAGNFFCGVGDFRKKSQFVVELQKGVFLRFCNENGVESPPLLFATQKIGEVGQSPGGVNQTKLIHPTPSALRATTPIRCAAGGHLVCHRQKLLVLMAAASASPPLLFA